MNKGHKKFFSIVSQRKKKKICRRVRNQKKNKTNNDYIIG